MGEDQAKPNAKEHSQMTESEAHRRLEDITRLVSDWVWEVDQEYKITFISERVFEVLGYHPRELIGKSLNDFIDFAIPASEDLSALIRRPFRDRPGTATKKNGEICHILTSGVPVFDLGTGDFEGVRGTADDVTARILAENKLRESEQHYRSLIEFQRTGILVHRDFKIVFANASAVRMFGAESVDDLMGRTSLDLTHSDYHEILKKRRASVEDKKEPQDFIELIHLRVDGSEFYAMDNAAPILWENEPAVLVSVSDISETKAAEQAAAISQQRFKEFAETAADRFWETDSEHKFVYISPPIVGSIILKEDAPIGHRRWDMPVLNLDGPEWVAHIEDLNAHKSFRNFHYQIKDDHGEVRHLISNGKPQFDSEGTFTGYRGTTIEETEQVRAVEKIAHIQQQFFTAIENFSEGFALWDAEENFVYCNSFFRLAHPGAQKYLLPEQKYRDFIKAFAISSNVKPHDNLDAWVKRRVEEFKHESSTAEIFREGKWIQIRKHKLNNGSTMVLYADITDLKERESALKSSEDRLHLITDAVPAMIAYHDRDLRFQFANKNFSTIGLDPKEIIGKTIQEVFTPENFARISPYIKKTFAGESITYDNYFITEDGKSVFTQVSLIPDFDSHGDVQGLFVLSFDITERKMTEAAIENSNKALDAAQNIAKIGSWERDLSSQTLAWSEEHYRIFGLIPGEQEVTTELFLSLVHPADREKVGQLSPSIASKITPHFSVDFRIIRPDGTERFIHGEGEAVYNSQGTPVSMRGTSQDITERKRAEEALDIARREAEFANKAKSEFLSSMSHELRTPMNAILGYAQLLLQTTKEPLRGRQIKQVNQILVSGQHLLKIINDILDLSKIESGHVALDLTYVDTIDTVKECIDLINSLAERHGIEVKPLRMNGTDIVVKADRTRLKQAVLNLLSNAIKYNERGGSVQISIKSTDNEKVRISVEDTGTGIPLERQIDIFEPFSRLGAEQKGIEGTGIGLTITKQLIELMDGEIGFFSTFGQGSTFWLELPASSHLENQETEQFLSHDSLQHISDTLAPAIYTLLYIEDDPSNLHLMEEVIDNVANLNLLTATSAEDGLEIARSEHPDIIIMDINLPGMSGLDAMFFLQSHSETQNIPVIALSAAAMPYDIEKGEKVGFYNYLTKPFNIEEVLTNINEALELTNEITYGNKSK